MKPDCKSVKQGCRLVKQGCRSVKQGCRSDCYPGYCPKRPMESGSEVEGCILDLEYNMAERKKGHDYRFRRRRSI